MSESKVGGGGNYMVLGGEIPSQSRTLKREVEGVAKRGFTPEEVARIIKYQGRAAWAAYVKAGA